MKFYIKKLEKIFLIVSIYFFCSNINSNEVKSIPVLISSNSTNYIKVLNQFQIYFKKNLELHFMQSLTEDEESLLIESLLKEPPELIISLGNLATNNLISYKLPVPILYSMVTASPTLNDFEAKNLCGINTDVPIKEFFSTIKEIDENNKNVVVFYSNPNTEYLAKEGVYEADRYDINYRMIKVFNKKDFKEKLENLNLQVHAIYLLPDSIIDQEIFNLVSNYSKNKKIILMTQIPYLINLGVTFSITPFYNRTGMYLSEVAGKIFENKNLCIDNKIFPLKEYSFNLNLEYAKESNLEIPIQIINRSQNNFKIIEAINQYEKNNFEISLAIMNKILEVDPTNKIAQFYRDSINEKLNGEKLKKLFEEANKYNALNNYKKEREIYKEILNIYPASKNAKEGINKSLYSESESNRELAQKMEKIDDIISAIIHLNEAIKIYPSNEKAKSDLKNLRSKELQKIPLYNEKGIKAYNERDYEESEKIFSKILLIDPGNRQADDYKKLSSNKKIGMKRYLECIKNNDKKCTLIWEDIKSWK